MFKAIITLSVIALMSLPAQAQKQDWVGAIAGTIMAERVCGLKPEEEFKRMIVEAGIAEKGEKRLAAEVKTMVRMMVVEFEYGDIAFNFCMEMAEQFDG